MTTGRRPIRRYTTHYTAHLRFVTWILQKTWGFNSVLREDKKCLHNYRHSSHYVLKTPVINHDRGKSDGSVTMTNMTYFVLNFWARYLSFYVNLFHVLVLCALYSIISFFKLRTDCRIMDVTKTAIPDWWSVKLFLIFHGKHINFLEIN